MHRWSRRIRERAGRKKKLMLFCFVTLLLIAVSISSYTIFIFRNMNRVSIPEKDDLLYIGAIKDFEGSIYENKGDNPGILIYKNRAVTDVDIKHSSAGSESKVTVNDNTVTNIALFGVDRRYKNQSSRSDSIIVVSIDGKNKAVKITSVMRDTYVKIPGRRSNRINAAYAFGGPLLAIKTMNANFGLDIRDYVSVDFFGLEKVIDRIGGVKASVSPEEAVWLNEYLKELNYLSGNNVNYIKAGYQLLNGRQVVAYCRIRYAGNADYERTERQRRVLNEVFKKIKAQGLIKLPGILSAFLPYIETSLSNTEIINIAVRAAGYNNDILEQFRIPADGSFKSQRIRGMAVLVPDIAENKKRLHKFIYGNN